MLALCTGNITSKRAVNGVHILTSCDQSNKMGWVKVVVIGLNKICAHPNGASYAYEFRYTRRMVFLCPMLLGGVGNSSRGHIGGEKGEVRV